MKMRGTLITFETFLLVLDQEMLFQQFESFEWFFLRIGITSRTIWYWTKQFFGWYKKGGVAKKIWQKLRFLCRTINLCRKNNKFILEVVPLIILYFPEDRNLHLFIPEVCFAIFFASMSSPQGRHRNFKPGESSLLGLTRTDFWLANF